ncbi:kinase-like domain-containing protein [Spinellus fusiger]|nr:kinase-like domain-containing protein [Spinellus fusiger]
MQNNQTLYRETDETRSHTELSSFVEWLDNEFGDSKRDTSKSPTVPALNVISIHRVPSPAESTAETTLEIEPLFPSKLYSNRPSDAALDHKQPIRRFSDHSYERTPVSPAKRRRDEGSNGNDAMSKRFPLRISPKKKYALQPIPAFNRHKGEREQKQAPYKEELSGYPPREMFSKEKLSPNDTAIRDISSTLPKPVSTPPRPISSPKPVSTPLRPTISPKPVSTPPRPTVSPKPTISPKPVSTPPRPTIPPSAYNFTPPRPIIPPSAYSSTPPKPVSTLLKPVSTPPKPATPSSAYNFIPTNPVFISPERNLRKSPVYQPSTSRATPQTRPPPSDYPLSYSHPSSTLPTPHLPTAKKVESPDIITVKNTTYRIISLAGSGGTSKVYSVIDEYSKELFAMKRISIDTKDKSTLNLYMNEINLLVSLNTHEQIVKMHDYEVNEQKQALFIVMELGETNMDKFMQAQRLKDLNFSFVRYFWQQMVEAVRAVHSMKIVHSDLKPANFMLVKGKVKLIDFGIANKISNDTTNVYRDHGMGTPNYMPPESMGGANVKISRASDVWSLGCILYQMIYEYTPFQHLNVWQKMTCIPNDSYEIAYKSIVTINTLSEDGTETISKEVSVDEGARDLMRGCLYRDPKKRLTLEQILAHPFLNM